MHQMWDLQNWRVMLIVHSLGVGATTPMPLLLRSHTQ